MKRFFLYSLSFILLSAPTFAFADTTTRIQQLLTAAASLEAQIASITTNQPLSCAALVSVPKVRVNQPFIIAWGSMGAIIPGMDPSKVIWTPGGASTIVQQQAGTWTYYFTFYDTNGKSVDCNAKIVVTP